MDESHGRKSFDNPAAGSQKDEGQRRKTLVNPAAGSRDG